MEYTLEEEGFCYIWVSVRYTLEGGCLYILVCICRGGRVFFTVWVEYGELLVAGSFMGFDFRLDLRPKVC